MKIKEEDRYIKMHMGWTNSVAINGILEYKPRIVEKTTPQGNVIRAMHMVLVQRDEYKARYFMVYTYSHDIINAISKIDKMCLMNCVGRLIVSKKGGYKYEIRVEEMKISNFFKYHLKEMPTDNEQESNRERDLEGQ